MLAGKGFKKVYNVAGGIKAWKSKKAMGSAELGMDLFKGKESPLDILKIAYSMEKGLCDFYISLEKDVDNKKVKALFVKLSKIEIKHQLSVLSAYNKIAGSKINQDEFETMIQETSLEGGLSTAEYFDLFNPDLNSETEVISLAMSIEAQALDLYQRLSLKIKSSESKNVINKIANEEKAHLTSLGKLLDNM